jgi:hypothetical protein
MGKAVVVGAVVVTVVQVVIASNSPVLDAAMVGGAVLFLVHLWDELVHGASRPRAERPSRPEVEPLRE